MTNMQPNLQQARSIKWIVSDAYNFSSIKLFLIVMVLKMQNQLVKHSIVQY
jgi:hypothetical protein